MCPCSMNVFCQNHADATVIFTYYGFNKKVQHLTWHKSPCKQFEKHLQDLSSLEVVTALGLPTCQNYPQLNTSYGAI
jgi:hypothetical protein